MAKAAKKKATKKKEPTEPTVKEYVLKRRKEHDHVRSRFGSVSRFEKQKTEVEKSETATSVKEDEDVNNMGVGSKDLIDPIYHPLVLTEFIESSSELRQIIACMIANTVGYGYRMIPRENGSKEKSLLLDEEIKAENFFEYVNSENCFIKEYEKGLWDYYLTGNMYFEIARDKKGRIAGLNHVASYQVRISKREEEAATIMMSQLLRTREGYEIRKRPERKRFRRFAQSGRISTLSGTIADGNGVWFKEFQDTRNYNRETGELLETETEVSKERKADNLAYELIHISAPQTRGVYGLPYHIGNIVSVNGDIRAENINIATFSNNNIPSMVIAVSGGQLTPGSVDRLSDFTQAKFQHSDNRSRFLLLESETMDDDSLDTGRSKIEIKSLHETQKEDSMFSNYSDECRASIRRAFRVPEILVGRGEAASGVVVAASMKLADEQVFSQERDHFTSWINRRLLPEMGIVNIKLALNSPNSNDPATLVALLTASEKTGAMTPEIARMIIEDIMSKKYPEFPEEFNEKLPFGLSMAEAVKKMNDEGQSNPSGSSKPQNKLNDGDKTEPTQTFTSQPQGDGAGS